MLRLFFKRLLPLFIICLGLVMAAGITFGMYYIELTPVKPVIKETATQPKAISTDSKSQHLKPFVSPLPTPTVTSVTQIEPIIQESPINLQVSPVPQPTYPPEPLPLIEPTLPPTPSPSPISEQVSITVSIDGSSFSLSMEPGKNHCDVLTQALSEGKIASLNMQYHPAFSSQAVYQINGQGQEGQVWWTYTVNDHSPPLGCSHVLINNHDHIRWTYVGPK